MTTEFAHRLLEARASGKAVGAFTCYNLEGLEGVLGAAESCHAPAIVLVSAASYGAAGGDRLVRALRAAIRSSAADLLVQLDHVTDPRDVERAVDAGFDAVMVDGSRRPFPENLAFTAAATTRLHRVGVGVEAELGRVEGDEERSAGASPGAMTDPAEALRFVTETGADCLAVAVGNVHGRYVEVPRIDWERLGELATEVATPLSLHGVSGLPDSDVRRAVGCGIAKTNVNTELRAAYFDALSSGLGDLTATLDVTALGRRSVDAMAAVVATKLALLGWRTEVQRS